MEIKRKFELQIVTNRRYLIRESPSKKHTACPECGKPMLPADRAAAIFDLPQRRVFQIVEIGAVHLTETKEGVMMICLDSLAKFIDESQASIGV